jgi:HSP20 family protein
MLRGRLFRFPEISRTDPFVQLDRMSREMDRLTRALFGGPRMGSASAQVFPAVNITEDRDKYYVRAELPGMQAGEVQIEAAGRNLTLSGERRIGSGGEGARYHRRERQAGRFSRIIGLPGDIDAEKIEARLVDGFLTVAVPKSEAAKPKMITVS